MRLTSDGDVLIGATSVNAGGADPKLSVQGDGGSNIGIIQVHAGGGESAGDLSGIAFSHGADNQIARPKAAIALNSIASYGKGDLCFYVDGANDNNTVASGDERMRIDSAGRVLIGLTSGSQANASIDDLQVGNPNSATQTGITLGSTDESAIAFADAGDARAGSMTYNHGANSMIFKINGQNERFRVNSNGITVSGSTDNTTAATITNTGTTGGNGLKVTSGGTGGGTLIFNVFRNNQSSEEETFRINGSGHVFINQVSTANPGTGNNTAGFCFQGMRFYGSGTNHAAMALNRSNDGIVALWYRGGVNVGNITVGGGGVAYNTTSDYRLKENVTAISDGITRLKTLKPSRFNFISEPGKTVDGFLAHEVTAVPESISGTKDQVALEDDDDLEIKQGEPIHQTMDQSKLIPLLTAALQEAITEIETLKTKVAALEGS